MSLKMTLGELNVITPKRFRRGRITAIVDDVWVKSGDWGLRAPRYRIGDWVRVQGRKVTVEPPIEIEPVLEASPSAPPTAERPAARLYRHDGTEGPFIRVPAIPWLNEWLREAQDGLHLFGDRLPVGPLGVRGAIAGCSCGEHGCGHLEVRIDYDSEAKRFVWSEMMATFSLHLGPSLSFEEEAYRTAAPVPASG